MKFRERRRSAASAARGAAADASRCLNAIAALPDAWGSLARSRRVPRTGPVDVVALRRARAASSAVNVHLYAIDAARAT